jgi:hypothetical protein
MTQAKKRLLFFCILGTIFLVGGCQTSLGLGKGVATGAEGAAIGAYSDTRSAFNFIRALDEWIKKNIW